MQADKGAIAIGGAKLCFLGEAQAQRRDMVAQRIVGALGIFADFRPLRLDPAILIAAPVIPRPAIEGTEFDAGQIVGDQVAAQHVALIDHAPQHAAPGFERQADRIAQARRIDAIVAGLGIDLQHGGAVRFAFQAIFADVAVRSDADIEQPVGADGQAAGPVHVRRLGRQVQNLPPLVADLGLAFLIGEGHQRIGVGDIEGVADQRHAIGRIEAAQEHRLGVRLAIAIGVAQQADAVGRGDAGAGLVHQEIHHPADDAGLRTRLAVGLGRQYVAIGQAQQRSRMAQPLGEALDH